MSNTIGVDIGGTKIAAGLVDDTGTILTTVRRQTPSRDAPAAVRAVTEIVAELTDWAAGHDTASATAVGVGVAAYVDAARRNVQFAANLGWTEVALADELERGITVPVVVENDANSASWGEFGFGAGRDYADMVCVTVGTGIGGGIVLSGLLLRGAYGIAAEVGHLQKVPDGRPCGCGQRGCWEQYASGSALVREARELAADRRGEAGILLGLGDGTPEGVRGRHITAAARAGDPVATAAFETVGSWLGRGLADLAALLDPEVLVIGGGVVDAGELLLGPARQAFLAHLPAAEHRVAARILPAQLGNAAGIVGAADLARVAR
ncbi:MAG TPA: ROK family glucokinase [Candidatus Nanopelagicales bacterium]|nr:ROK family glucokinase [Candidatus Nanopelagicales bacterium]